MLRTMVIASLVGRVALSMGSPELELASAGSAAAAVAPASQGANPASARITTTIDALTTYSLFFHARAVRVRGTLRELGASLVLTNGDASVLLVGPEVAGTAPGPDTVRDVSGMFLDVGRLEDGDPRLLGVDIHRLSRERLQKPWPGAGELRVVKVTSIARAEPLSAPSVRAVAIAPERYVNATVTVTGRFRGRNLYGDQPAAPNRSRWDFVLQLADASVWVVGMRPRGRDFNLDVDARVDTGRWLEVSGVVRRERGLVLLEAERIAEGDAPVESRAAEPVARVPTVGPRPEVVFSVPSTEETDVPLATRVRIQFSRDLDPKSFEGQVVVRYATATAGERGGAPPPIEFATKYDAGARVLEISFKAPLEPYRTVVVELSDRIGATDGATLVPWTLTFTLGG